MYVASIELSSSRLRIRLSGLPCDLWRHSSSDHFQQNTVAKLFTKNLRMRTVEVQIVGKGERTVLSSVFTPSNWTTLPCRCAHRQSDVIAWKQLNFKDDLCAGCVTAVGKHRNILSVIPWVFPPQTSSAGVQHQTAMFAGAYKRCARQPTSLMMLANYAWQSMLTRTKNNGFVFPQLTNSEVKKFEF